MKEQHPCKHKCLYDYAVNCLTCEENTTMIVPEPKIIKSWSDFDGERTEKFELYDGCALLNVRRKDHTSVTIYKLDDTYRSFGVTIPEAILILNALGFNFKEGE